VVSSVAAVTRQVEWEYGIPVSGHGSGDRGASPRLGCRREALVFDPKGKSLEEIEILALRAMTPQKRLETAMHLSEMVRTLFREGLRQRFPEASEEELHRIYLERMELCHNRNS
jgi:hypothetical protein